MIGVSVAKKSYMDGEEPEVGEMIVITDYISAGNLIGEMGLLTSSRRNSSCTCESAVQVLIFPDNTDVSLCKLDFVSWVRTEQKKYGYETTKLELQLPQRFPESCVILFI